MIITQDLVGEVAFKLYRESGNAEGHDLENWLEAERIVWNGIEEETECILQLRT